jgi:hypothetical protein
MTFSSTETKLYINGVLENTGAANSYASNTLVAIRSDRGDGSSSGRFFGKTKQLKVFKTALSDNELEYLTTYGNIPTWSTYNEMALGFNYTIQ